MKTPCLSALKPSKTGYLIFTFFLFSPVLLWAGEKLDLAAPVLMPAVTAEMNRPGFWITVNPSPDAVILNPAETEDFNSRLYTAGLLKDIFKPDAFDFKIAKSQIQNELRKFERGNYFDKEGHLASRELFKKIGNNIILDDTPGPEPRYAFVGRRTDQRLLPTDETLTFEPFDLAFDELQNSSLDPGEPVAVFFETADEKWVYAQTKASAGWLKKTSLEFVSSDEFNNLVHAPKFCVVTAPKADLYSDQARTQFYDFARMGSRFAVTSLGEETIEITIAPGRNLFMDRRDIHIGYLLYTPRTVIGQAFKMLNAPYGWGGENGEQDCSAYLKEIFATVGIDLPRNSSEQGKVGRLLTGEKDKIFQNALPGITLAQLKGHIVLFLGNSGGRSYAIHEAFAYREPAAGKDRTRVINRVIVSDLSLGEGTKKGSLSDRIIAVREIR